MSECVRLSDRIPDVALGRSSWTAEEETHLRDCADCRAEWALVRAAAALGARAPAVSPPVAMADAIERRLARDRVNRRQRRRAWSLAGLAAAAAVALAVWTGAPGRRTGNAGGESAAPAATQALVPLPELEALEPAELDSLLRTMEAPLAGSSTLDAPTLGELEDSELEQVLASWEG
jgi:hypothetical protein